ncbi:MAG: hypothetical protein ACI4PQ_06570 [Butyricicoccaceae bacterium]
MQQNDLEAIIRSMEQKDPNTHEAAQKLRAALGTQQGQKTAQDITRRYGNVIAQAAGRLQAGDQEGAKRVMQSILNTPDGAKLAAELTRMLR